MQIEANREIDSYLLSVVCHDLANALMIFELNLIRIQQESSVLSQAAKLSLEKSLNAHRKAKDILTMARQVHGLNAGKLVIQFRKVSLRKCLESLIADVQSTSAKKNLSFEFLDWVDDDSIVTDETILVHQIMYNLISNAIKFSYRGSVIYFGVKATDQHLTFFISDSGQGMSALKVTRIFQISKPTSSQGTESEPGFGMGLPIVYFFVNLLKAQIQVYSRERGPKNNLSGTCFEIVFPRFLPLE